MRSLEFGKKLRFRVHLTPGAVIFGSYFGALGFMAGLPFGTLFACALTVPMAAFFGLIGWLVDTL